MALTQVSDAGLVKPASDLQDNEKIVLGTGNDLEIYHNGSNSKIDNTTGTLYIQGDIVSLAGGGGSENLAVFTKNAGVELYYDNSKKFETDANGVKITGQCQITSHAAWPDSSGDYVGKALFGGGEDLQIYHSGSQNFIKATNGRINLLASETRMESASGSEGIARFIENGSVELNYDNGKKFETTSTGALVSGILQAKQNSGNAAQTLLKLTNNDATSSGETDQTADIEFEFTDVANNAYKASKISCYKAADWHGNADYDAGLKFFTVNNSASFENAYTERLAITENGELKIPDNGKFVAGAGDDLQIYHNGTDSYIDDDGTGQLRLCSNELVGLNAAHSEYTFKAFENGATELYYDGTRMLRTTATGGILSGSWSLTDDNKMMFGSSDDLYIYHDGSTNIIDGRYHDIELRHQSEVHIKCIDDGATQLYYDNSEKIKTTSTGIEVSGKLLAHQTLSDSDWTSGTRHVLQSNVSDAAAVVIEHSDDTAPYGLYIDFSDDDPDNNTRWFAACADSSATRFRIYSDGDAWTSDAGTLTSDQTLKENITDATSKLEDLKKIKVRNFNWKSSFHPEKSKKKQLGFIAQEVEQVFPSLISEHDVAPGEGKEGHVPVMKKAIKDAWAPILVKALQEAITKIETLETEVAALKAK